MIIAQSDIGRAMSASLFVRDVSNDVNGVKHTFSGWDSCMQKAYCKWPVIVGIIIASLIVLSVVFCVARCLCCGAECACCCFRCCAGCCPSPRSGRRNNYAPAPAPPPIYQQPQPYSTPYSSAAPPTYSTKPQFARFDMSRKGGVGGGRNEDALPAMPSWDEAANHKIEVEEEPEGEDGHEMQHLDPHNNTPGSYTPNPTYPAAAAATIGTNPATMRSHQGTPTQNPYYSHSDVPQTSPYGPQHSPSPYHNGAGGVPYSPPISPPQQHGYGSPPPPPHAQGAPYAGSDYSYGGGYAPSGSTRYEPSNVGTAYQGAGAGTPYQPKQYQAYGGGSAGGASPGVERKPVQGSWRDI